MLRHRFALRKADDLHGGRAVNDRPNSQGDPADGPLPSPLELRRWEDQLDWLENHRPRRRMSVFLSPLIAVVALVTGWLFKTGQWPSK